MRFGTVFSPGGMSNACAIAEVFPDSNYTDRGLWRQYLPHALSLVHEDEFRQRRKDYSDLLENMADFLRSDGSYREAELLYTDLMRWRTEKDGHRHPDTLASMANLTSTYLNQGRWTEAEALGVQVLETSKTVLGTEHPAPGQHEQPFLYPDVSRKAPRS